MISTTTEEALVAGVIEVSIAEATMTVIAHLHHFVTGSTMTAIDLTMTSNEDPEVEMPAEPQTEIDLRVEESRAKRS